MSVINKIKVDDTEYDISADYENITNTPNLADVATSGSYNDLSNKPTIPSNTSDLTNDSGFIDKSVNDLTYYTLATNTGATIELSINSSTYVMTMNLKNSAGTTISTGTVDLPLESVVVNGSYDSTNKKIILTLQSGSTIDIPVGDLVSGLQSEITSSNKLSADLIDDTNTTNKLTNATEKSTWNAKYDLPSGGIPSTDLSSAVQTSLGKADTAIQDISGKQDTLVSGTNIKTINNTSILGSGNIDTEVIQYSTMPTASSSTVGKIVQFTGTTDSTYTNGYFYIGTTDGQGTPTYSWANINVQAGSNGGIPVFDLEVNEGIQSNKPFILETHTKGIYIVNSINSYSELYIKARSSDTTVVNTKVLYGSWSKTAFYYNGEYSYEYSGVLLKLFEPGSIEVTGNASNTFLSFNRGAIYKSANSYSITVDTSTGTGNNNVNLSKVDLINRERTISAKKTFSVLPESSVTPTTNYQFANKKYVDDTTLLKAYQLAGLSEYSASSTYAIGDYVYYNSLIYKCNTTISVAEAWDSTHWTQKTYMEYMSDILIGNALGGSY